MRNLSKYLAGAVIVAAGSVAAVPASAMPILVFSQVGLGTPVSGVASGSSTTISGSNISILISGIDAAVGNGALAFLNFSTLSTDAATMGTSGNVRQNYNGTFSITSGAGSTGINYLSGTFNDLFEALNTSATLIASTPPASAVTFTSDVIPLSHLGLDRAVSLSFSGVTPGILAPNANGTVPSFRAAVSGNFSAETGAVPEPATWGMMVVGFGAMGYAMRSRRKVAVSFG